MGLASSLALCIAGAVVGPQKASTAPRGFVENVGQFDERAAFVGWHSFGTSYVTREGLRFRWADGYAASLTFEGGASSRPTSFASARPEPYHFFFGQDPSGWRRSVRSFDTVVWEGIYPGIDACVHWSRRGMEYDFLLSPGADPDDIVVRLDGFPEIVDDGAGGLRLETPAGTVHHGPPVSSAFDGDRRWSVASSVRRIDARRIGFELAPEARGRRAVIDPVLTFSTLLGGVSAVDRAIDVAFVSSGAVIAGGSTNSADFPVTAGSYSETLQKQDVYIARLSPDGTTLEFGTFLGSWTDDSGGFIALHSDESIYVTGITYATNWPLTPGAVDTTFAGFWEGFVTRLSPQGDALLFSTYLGGTDELLKDIAVDAAGNAYVCGYAASADYPVTAGAFDVAFAPLQDAVVTVLDPTGTSLLWSTFLGGTTGGEEANGIDVDTGGAVYVAGRRGQGSGIPTSDFPITPGAFQDTTAGGGQTEVFVTKFEPGGAKLAYSTFLVGYQSDWGRTLAVDPWGQAVVAGSTQSSDFPTTPGAFDSTFNSLIDGFVTKVSADGTSLVWSTFLSGNSYDKVLAVDVDVAGSVVAASETSSTSMPVTPDAVIGSKPAFQEWGHLAKIDATGANVTYGTYLGGSDTSVNGAYGVAFGPGGRVACVGDTGSSIFPVTPGAFDTTLSGFADGFVTSFDLCGGAWLVHGSGCIGTGGAAPTLAGEGCPAPGETVTVSIGGGAPGALGFLVFAPTTATLPVTGACALAIGPLIGPAIPLVLSPAGALSFASTIPGSAPPGVVQIQSALLDPAAPDGVSATNAVRVRVGY